MTTPRKSEPGKAWAQLVAACGRWLAQPDDTTARRVHAALDHWMTTAHPNRTRTTTGNLPTLTVAPLLETREQRP